MVVTPTSRPQVEAHKLRAGGGQLGGGGQVFNPRCRAATKCAQFNDKTADNFENPGSEVGQPKIAKNLGGNSPKNSGRGPSRPFSEIKLSRGSRIE